MPKSSVRKKKVYTPPVNKSSSVTSRKKRPSSPWVPGTALGLAAVGMVWLVVYYLSSGAFPIPAGPQLNIGIGFGCIVSSLVIFTRWR